MEAEPLSRLTRDLLVEILSRVGDGPTLASAACTCRGLRRAAKEEVLWEELCHGAWPSTLESAAKELVSSMPGGFSKLYADSLPLLLYNRRPSQKRGVPPANGDDAWEPAVASYLDLVSFVDVYYKKKCFLSRVLYGVPLLDNAAGSLCCHFKVSISSTGGAGGMETGEPHGCILLKPKEGGVGVLNWALEEDITLSWVLADVKSGRAVNLSGGKPVVVQSSWPSSNGEVVVRFGCAMPVEKQLLACGVAECLISLRCQYSDVAEDISLRCTEIELQVEDGEGALHLDGRRSLAVLSRALCDRTRTRNLRAAEEGYREYFKDRREMRDRKMSKEGVLAETLCALSALAMSLSLCVLFMF